MPAKKSKPSKKFDLWFRLQHGPRRLDFLGNNDQGLEELIGFLSRAQAELSRRRTYDARQTSALYAWNARGPQKKAARSKGKRSV